MWSYLIRDPRVVPGDKRRRSRLRFPPGGAHRWWQGDGLVEQEGLVAG